MYAPSDKTAIKDWPTGCMKIDKQRESWTHSTHPLETAQPIMCLDIFSFEFIPNGCWGRIIMSFYWFPGFNDFQALWCVKKFSASAWMGKFNYGNYVESKHSVKSISWLKVEVKPCTFKELCNCLSIVGTSRRKLFQWMTTPRRLRRAPKCRQSWREMRWSCKPASALRTWSRRLWVKLRSLPPSLWSWKRKESHIGRIIKALTSLVLNLIRVADFSVVVQARTRRETVAN